MITRTNRNKNGRPEAAWIAAVLCLAATAVPAQDLRFDPAITAACLAEKPVPEAGACVGRAAQACMTATPDGGSTVGMSFCLRQEHDWWDARLNDTYVALRVVSQKMDAELDDLGSHAPRLTPALRDMQRAWIPYRDAACTYERVQWGGGTGGGPATWACLMDMTGRQALRLQDRLDRSQQQ